MKHIKEKDIAIHFETRDYLGQRFSLSDFKGKKVLLSFFRGASCPFCNLRINELIKRDKDFKKKNIQIITVFAATKEEITSYAGEQNPPFPILADPKLELYTKYGIEESSSGMYRAMINPIKIMRVMFSGFFNMKSMKDRPIIPADFLIDKDFKIYKAYYGRDFGDHIPIEEVLDWQ